MPRPPLNDEQVQAMRTRILDATLSLLLKVGPRGLTSRAIADILGIAHMTLFTYFENQAAILEALSAREMAPILMRQEALEREAEHGDIYRVMREALAVYPRFAAEHPALFQLAWAGPQMEGGNPARARAHMHSHVVHLARLARLGMARGTFHKRDPILAAAAVFGMVTFPLIMYANSRIDDLLLRDALVAEMLDASLLYLTHSPAVNDAGPGGGEAREMYPT
jgi:AcrR family transcriptional regulator